MKTTYKPDPAGMFGAALSVYTEARMLAKSNGNDLSEAYNGHDEFMRQCVRVGREFEAWACKHVDFEALGEVWPYHMHDSFGRAALQVIGSECELDQANAVTWPWIAGALKLPMREDARGWVVYTEKPTANHGFNENLTTIKRLCGSSMYEYKQKGLTFHIRAIK